jgi:hypothetical protein
MRKTEYISIFAAVFELAQLYLLGERIAEGFIFGVVAGVLWITYSIVSKNAWGLLVICPVALFLNIRGFMLWQG